MFSGPDGARNPCKPAPETMISSGSLSSICTPSARSAAIVARQSSPARKPRIVVCPSASAPSISARCEIDLSPGTDMRPAAVPPGWTLICVAPLMLLSCSFFAIVRKDRQQPVRLRLRTHRNPQVIRQPVVGDRTDNYTITQQELMTVRSCARDRHAPAKNSPSTAGIPYQAHQERCTQPLAPRPHFQPDKTESSPCSVQSAATLRPACATLFTLNGCRTRFSNSAIPGAL